MPKKKELKFEEAVNKLEIILDELEGDDVELEHALKLFEDGITISKRCTELLDKAENKIKILLKKSDGSIEEKDYDEEIFNEKLRYSKKSDSKKDQGDKLPF
ncbi:exodeoxyribonuclease VII small subunit [bacterium]|nr:exodeoxyribonuclease VII small subunit [bacterium]